MDYTVLSLAQVQSGLDAAATDVQATFGRLDARQVNWRPDATRWSVAQCLEHLLAANRLMARSAEEALAGTGPSTVWQRMPGLPRLLGRLLIRSQAPQATRKYTAPSAAQPATSDVTPDVVGRFVAHTRELGRWLRGLDEARVGRVVMTSPFASFITYSVLDGVRLILAHDHRHVEQARRVVQTPGFPS